MLSILLLATLLSSVQAEIKPDALEWFRKGEAMIGTEQAYSAEQAENFRKAVELQPDFAAARYNLALTYLGRDDFDLALEQLNALQPLEPEQPRSYFLRAEIYLRTDRAVEAEKDLQKAVTLTPKDAEAWQYLGRAQFQQGRFEQALQSQREAATLAPDLDGLAFDQAVTLQRLGMAREAADSFRRHLNKHPGDFEAHTLLAILLVKLGDREDALHHFLEAERIQPSDAEIRERTAALLLDLGKLDEAKSRLEGSDSPAALANLGLIARRENRLDEAVAYFSKAASKEPGNAEMWVNLGDALFAKHDEVHALAAYGKAVELGASDYETLFNLGALYANQNDNLNASKWLQKALQVKPTAGAAHFSLGIVLERLDDPEKALEQYRLAVANGADNARLHFRLAVLYSRRSDTEDAYRHLELCLREEADKYLPIIDKELINVHSDFDSIRYTLRFGELLKKYRSATPPPQR